MCQNEGAHQIVMSFLPLVVGCLHKKMVYREGGWMGGGGHRYPRTLLAMPLVVTVSVQCLIE